MTEEVPEWGVMKSRKKYEKETPGETTERKYNESNKKCYDKVEKKFEPEIVSEREMTDAEKKKREEIVLSLKKKKKDFQDRYGDDWENVMYATATKMAMGENMKKFTEFQESKIEEAFKVGDKVKISKTASKGTKSGHKDVLGKTGKIIKDYGDGDMKVNFGGNDDRSVSAKDLVKEESELEEKKSDYEDQIKAYLAKGGKIQNICIKNPEIMFVMFPDNKFAGKSIK